MKSRFRVGTMLLALAAQLLTPLAAYASMPLPTGFDDFCSVIRGAKDPGPAPALPRPSTPKHGSSHCASCSGSASAALLPSIVAATMPPARAEPSLSRPARPSIATATVRLPPTRAPPVVS